METKHYAIEEILKNLSIAALNKMQTEMLDTFSKKANILLLSPTGSGKTLGFLLPILSKLNPETNGVQVLILAPSRELALQIESVFKSMKTPFKVNCCYGGHPFKIERNNLSVPPAVLIGTPGRIADHIDKATFKVDTIHTLIFDEFDKSLEFGFTEEMKFIVRSLPSLQHRILTSATHAIEVPEFVGTKQYTELNYLTTANQSAGLTVKIVLSDDVDKLDIFLKLISSFQDDEPVIVFCNHREAVERVSAHLTNHHIINECFHGGLDQEQREQVLAKFKNRSTNILVTTDLASRGLDISDIKHIIHYQKPTAEDIFVHRNGRTARMGKEGTAYILLNATEQIPDYIVNAENFSPTNKITTPSKPKWVTLFIEKGKKDKVNKMDIVGFLSKVGNLTKDELGLIEVKDYFSYAAVDRRKANEVIKLTSGQKIKNKAAKISIV